MYQTHAEAHALLCLATKLRLEDITKTDNSAMNLKQLGGDRKIRRGSDVTSNSNLFSPFSDDPMGLK